MSLPYEDYVIQFGGSSVMSLAIKVRAARKLGLTNIGRVALYRLGLGWGLHPVLRLQADITGQRFFEFPQGKYSVTNQFLPVSERWKDEGLYFGWRRVSLDGHPPDWHINPFLGTRVAHPEWPWHRIPDFDPTLGDIKTVWEASRFDWLLPMAQRARHGDDSEIERLNAWIADWCAANPAYQGPNWKCGQEVAIRIMHLAVAARLLGQDAHPLPDLLRLVLAHVMRIHPTISYAVGQDNNHGTSEAVGLFVGGHWCYANGVKNGMRWARVGRRLLEDRVRRLIQPDGSFSEYSVNYHRLMLDTLCIAELWRRWHRLDAFSPLFYERARAAATWLYTLVNAQTGDAPNVGANDGARLLPLTDADYRDYRPTVQLAMALFHNRRAYPARGEYCDHLAWLGVPVPEIPAAMPGSVQFDDGGYAVLRHGAWFAVMRYPRYHFRPSHCDALHVDLWYEKENLLRDGGSYSYHTEDYWYHYFPGTASHNTVQFDGRDQMPRLGRFLWGEWLQAYNVQPAKLDGHTATTSASYRDWKGAMHSRRIQLCSRGLTVHDNVAGFSQRAVLRWRLKPGDWQLLHDTDGSQDRVSVICPPFKLEVRSDTPVSRCELVEGWESRYYLQKTPLPVLEVEVQSPGSLTTEVVRIEG